MGSSIYRFRRPAFLSFLSDKNYTDVYKRLLLIEDPVPSPAKINKVLKSSGEFLSTLCLMVIFMVDPTWKLPAGSQLRELNSTDLTVVMSEKCFPPVELLSKRNPNGVSFQEYEEIMASQKKKVLVYITELHDYILTTKATWDVRMVRHCGQSLLHPQLWMAIYILTYVFQASIRVELNAATDVIMTEDMICRFVDRFAHEPWRGFLGMYIRTFGARQLRGCMKYFNDDPLLLVCHPQLLMVPRSRLTAILDQAWQ